MIALIRFVPYVLIAAAIAAVLTFTYQQGVKSERLRWIEQERLEQLQIDKIRDDAVKMANEEHENQKAELSNIINNLVNKNEKLNRDINVIRSSGLFINRKAICENRVPTETDIASGSSKKPGESDSVRLPEAIERELRADYENTAKLASECGILLDYARSAFEIK